MPGIFQTEWIRQRLVERARLQLADEERKLEEHQTTLEALKYQREALAKNINALQDRVTQALAEKVTYCERATKKRLAWESVVGRRLKAENESRRVGQQNTRDESRRNDAPGNSRKDYGNDERRAHQHLKGIHFGAGSAVKDLIGTFAVALAESLRVPCAGPFDYPRLQSNLGIVPRMTCVGITLHDVMRPAVKICIGIVSMRKYRWILGSRINGLK